MKLFVQFTDNEGSDRFIYNEARPQGNDTGPLKVEHIEGLTEAQKTDEAIHEALAKFNAKFQEEEGGTVLKCLAEIDPEITIEDIPKLQQYAKAVEEKIGKGSADMDIDDLDLGLPDADDGLGLDLPETKSEISADNPEQILEAASALSSQMKSETLTGSAGEDDLGLALPEAEASSTPKAEKANFSPSTERCRDCAIQLVDGFEDKPQDFQNALVSEFVSLETITEKPITKIDESHLLAAQNEVTAKYRENEENSNAKAKNLKSVSENKKAITEDKKAITEKTEDTAEKAEDTAEKAEANEALIADLKAKLKADTMDKSQIDNILSDKAAWNEIPNLADKGEKTELLGFKAQLLATQNDLKNVSSIAPADNPKEAAVLNQIVSSTPVSWKAKSPSVRYATIISAIDTGALSDDTKRRAKEALGIKISPTTHVKTGGDVKDVFKKGGGTETYVDENGEVQTRNLPLAPGKDVKIRENQYLSVDNAGNKELKVKTSVGDYKVSLPDNPTDEDMTQIVSSTQMIAVFHDLNLAEVMYGRPLNDRGGGEIELRFPGDFNRTKQLSQILFGGTAGYDGEILEQGDIDKIPYLMQFHSSKGDAMRGDANPKMMQQDLEKQGVIENGNVNWARFEQMVMANRANMYTAPENFAG